VRYPLALRRKITAIARRRRSQGAGIATIAHELGLAEWTLNLWLRKSSVPVLRAVEMVPTTPAPASATTTSVLITPQGIRVEGATVDALATLLRALR
jgi:hypothetical protein